MGSWPSECRWRNDTSTSSGSELLNRYICIIFGLVRFSCVIGKKWLTVCVKEAFRSVVKSRLQLQRKNNVYKGMRHAFAEILKVEGVGALYRVCFLLIILMGQFLDVYNFLSLFCKRSIRGVRF